MKRYAFRLESVRKVRRIEEDRAKGALALANAAAQRAADEVARREALYDALPTAPPVAATTDFLTDRWRRTASSATVLGGLQDERDAEIVVAERRADWTEAATRVSALDRLDERRREEHALGAARQEAIVVDELVTSRFVAEATKTQHRAGEAAR